MTLYMMIGLPGSGKTAYTNYLPGFVHSFEITKEKHPDFTDKEIYDMMYQTTEAALKAKADVVYDAENLTRKKRQKVLKMAKGLGAKTVAVLLLTPFGICKRRCQRPNPEKVVDDAAKLFNLPSIPEFDDIKVVQYIIEDDEISFDFASDNGYNVVMLMNHLQRTEELLESKDEALIEAAKFHDIGKAFTSVYSSEPEMTSDLRFFGHENYGAYWYLTTRKVGQLEMEVAKLINYHMCPYIWDISNVARKTDTELMGEEFVEKLMILHEANKKAHD